MKSVALMISALVFTATASFAQVPPGLPGQNVAEQAPEQTPEQRRDAFRAERDKFAAEMKADKKRPWNIEKPQPSEPKPQ